MHRAKRDIYNNAFTDTHGSDRRKKDEGSRGRGDNMWETAFS
jgi:hypothetical protein